MLKSVCRQACLWLLSVFFVLQAACAETSQFQAVQSALDTTAVAVNTSWELSVGIREMEQRVILEKARNHTIEVDEAERLIAEVRALWEPRMHAFRAVHHAHEVAVRVFEAVKRGEEPMTALIASLSDLINLYGNLRELIEPLLSREANP